MGTNYVVRTGRDTVALRVASTPHEALRDYLRGIGCRDDEMVRMGEDRAAWRGAVYVAAPAPSDTDSRD
jgi:hypothetical protein